MSTSTINRPKEDGLTTDKIKYGQLLECTGDGDIVMVCEDTYGEFELSDNKFVGVIVYTSVGGRGYDRLGTVRPMDVGCFKPFQGDVTLKEW